MTDSSSDSDCFESADEEFDDDVIPRQSSVTEKPDLIRNEISSQKSCSSKEPVTRQDSDSLKNSMQYRKRPEKSKPVARKAESALHTSRKISLSDQIFKADIIKPDVFIQDITSNLSKNINKGFDKIQKTSSSIKDLVFNSLPVSNQKEAPDRFLYDDDDEEISIRSDTNSKKSISPDHSKSDDAVHQNAELSSAKIKSFKTENMVKSSESDSFDFGNSNSEHSTEFHKSSKENIPENDPSNIVMDDRLSGKINNNTNLQTNMETFEDSKEDSDLKSNLNSLEQNGEEKLKVEEPVKEKFKETVKANIEEAIIEKEEDSPVNDIHKDSIMDAGTEESKNTVEGWDSSELDLDDLEINSANNNENTKDTNEVIPAVSVPVVSNKSESLPDHSYESGTLGNVSPEVRNQNFVDQPNDIDKNEKENYKTKSEEIDNDDNEGWDDFDIDDDDIEKVAKETGNSSAKSDISSRNEPKERDTKWTGWDDFAEKKESQDSYGRNGGDTKWSGWDNFGGKQESKSSWNLGGWGVNALLNTATSVTQGISNVLEAGLGAPDPQTLARMEREAEKSELKKGGSDESRNARVNEQKVPEARPEESGSGLNLFPVFGITNLVAGVTNKIVEPSKLQEIGSRVISGGLDTLESFGKKTMEVLQEGDPGLKKKRALLLGDGKPILSQVLREAKTKAEQQDRKLEEKQMAKMCHFETLFDDFQGLIYLEALEMLSKQCELKLEQIKAGLPMDEVEESMGILEEVKELCDIDEDEFKSNYATVVDFKISLAKAVEPLKNEISIQKITQVYDCFNDWIKADGNSDKSPRVIFQKAMSVLAELTAATVQQFHKGGEFLSIKEHRKTVEEADVLLQLTGLLCCEINEISLKFLQMHKSLHNKGDADYDVEIVNKIREETENATSYIKDAFNLLLPVLQLGAAT